MRVGETFSIQPATFASIRITESVLIAHSKSVAVPEVPSKSYPMTRGRINRAPLLQCRSDDLSVEIDEQMRCDAEWTVYLICHSQLIQKVIDTRN
jgi:hypothetical protein